MVYIKQLIVATSLLLSGALAAPVPEHDLSVARSDLAIEARGFNDAPVVEIEARARTKKPGVTQTNAPKTSSSSVPKATSSSVASKSSSSSASKATSSSAASKSSSSSASKATSSSAGPKPSGSSVVSRTSSGSATNSGSSTSGSKTSSASVTKTGTTSGTKTASASVTKTGTTSGTTTASASSSSASGTKVSSSASACARPTKSPRSLERREGPLKPAKSQLDINEDLYVIDAKGKSVVTNLSGCTAVFLWDENNVPSIFHILCSQEAEKTWEAMNKVNGESAKQAKTKAYSIIANDQGRYNAAKKEIEEYAVNMDWTKPREIKQSLYKVNKSEKDASDRPRWLWKATTESGSTTIRTEEYTNPDYNSSC